MAPPKNVAQKMRLDGAAKAVSRRISMLHIKLIYCWIRLHSPMARRRKRTIRPAAVAVLEAEYTRNAGGGNLLQNEAAR